MNRGKNIPLYEEGGKKNYDIVNHTRNNTCDINCSRCSLP